MKTRKGWVSWSLLLSGTAGMLGLVGYELTVLGQVAADWLREAMVPAGCGVLAAIAAPVVPADLLKRFKDFAGAHVAALNGILEKLPEQLREGFKTLKEQLSAHAEELSKLEFAPSLDAEKVLGCFSEALGKTNTCVAGLLEKVGLLQKDLSEKATALSGWDEKVKSGELLTKERHTQLLELAKAEAAKALQPTIRTMRQASLETAGIPGASDAILDLAQEAYDARVGAAKANLAKLAEKGLKPGGKGDKLARQLIWLEGTEFAGQFEAITDALSAPGGGGHPLIGNPGAPDDKKEKLLV